MADSAPQPHTTGIRTSLRRLFAALRGPTQPPPRSPVDVGDLLCGACGSSFVCPMDWDTDGETGWRIDTRCGECGSRDELRLSNQQAASFDVALGDQVAMIAQAADLLEAERAARDLRSLIEALEHDLIGPADFAAAPIGNP